MANETKPADLSDMCYDNTIGQLVWKSNNGPRRKQGCIVGWSNKAGYRFVRIAGVRKFAHRVIYEMFKGPIPEGMEIDHRDGNPRNNHIDNLRLANHSQNMRNQRVQGRSTTGIKGVGFDKKTGLYRARVKTNGITVCKMFSDIVDAGNWVADERERQHTIFHNHG